MHLSVIFTILLAMTCGLSAVEVKVEKGNEKKVILADKTLVVYFTDDIDGIKWVEGKDVIILARWSKISNGCKIYCYDKAGIELYSTDLVGLGPVEHSKYHNDVNIFTINDKIYIFGNESFGKYCEIRSISDGKLINIEVSK